MQYDIRINGGLIFDGNGGEPYVADIAISDGVIQKIGSFEGDARKTLDAQGMIVTPGFVDLHTHYDGQISWDEMLEPSVYHGVTTVVMGNCGVGFAPVHEADRGRLISLMEGVEDIPGTALHEGINWDWERFPEYMDAIEKRPHTLDFAVYVPHDPLRVYVMRDRGIAEEDSTVADRIKMAEVLREALAAGAIGFSTGRSDVHRSANGENTPASEATKEELVALASVLSEFDHGVLQAVSDFDLLKGPEHFDREFALLEAFALAGKSPVSISLTQRHFAPKQWEHIIERCEQLQSQQPIRLQVAPRGIGVMLGLSGTFHPLMAFPSYLEISHLPLADRVSLLRDPERKRRILSEKPVLLAKEGSSVPPLADMLLQRLDEVSRTLFLLGHPPQYEQSLSESIFEKAKRKGVSHMEYLYDVLLEDDGKAMLYFPIYNYAEGDFSNVLSMLRHPLSLPGLSDGGAHVGMICDAGFPTYLIQYWTRDREGEKLPLPWVVSFLTKKPADFLGLSDRGVLEVGKKADINVIDYHKLGVEEPYMVADLPAGAQRLMQRSTGMVATFVSGVPVVENSQLTRYRPGRLVRAGKINNGR
ncbi:MAG: amidohydrolase family protein [Myxococcota bacterium]|nr:amidohydrolase family protein [Myxococcota bacterium]